MGTEVGGRWSAEAATFSEQSSPLPRARDAPLTLGGSVRAAWLRRWQGMLGFAAARGLRSVLSSRVLLQEAWKVPTPSMNAVLGDARFWLS